MNQPLESILDVNKDIHIGFQWSLQTQQQDPNYKFQTALNLPAEQQCALRKQRRKDRLMRKEITRAADSES